MNNPEKILVFGTFDVVHPGHLNFFEQARALSINSYLIVSIARDQNVLRIKGKLPEHDEQTRLKEVGECPLVDEALLGSLDDYIAHIVSVHPDIIALGYDQTAYTESLAEKLAAHHLHPKIVRLKPYHPETYKTSLMKKA